MDYLATAQDALVVGAARSADLSTTEALLVGLWPHCSERVKSAALNELLRRYDQMVEAGEDLTAADALILKLANKPSLDIEYELARCAFWLPLGLEQRLSRSRRKVVTRAVASREKLSVDTAVRLCEHSDRETCDAARMQMTIPFYVKQELMKGSVASKHLTHWCRSDVAFCKWYLSGWMLINALTRTQRQRTGVDLFVFLGADLDDELVDLVLVALGDTGFVAAHDKSIGHWLRERSMIGRRRDEVVSAVIEAYGHLPGSYTLESFLNGLCENTLDENVRRASHHGVRLAAWNDEGTLLAALSSDKLRGAALSSRFLAGDALETLVQEAVSTGNGCVDLCTNVNLTAAQGDALAAVLPPKEGWRMYKTTMSVKGRALLLSRSSVLVEMIAYVGENQAFGHNSGVADVVEWIEPWLEEEVMASLFSPRIESLGSGVFRWWAKNALARYPHLSDLVLGSVMRTDILDASLGGELAKRFQERIGDADQASSVAGLVRTWHGTMDGLFNAARKL